MALSTSTCLFSTTNGNKTVALLHRSAGLARIGNKKIKEEYQVYVAVDGNYTCTGYADKADAFFAYHAEAGNFVTVVEVTE